MFFAEAQIRVQLYDKPCDMRKSYDGLSALARNALGRDPLDGSLYVFVNRRGTHLKCLYFDRSESGRFIADWRVVITREMDWTGLKMPIEGIEVRRVAKRFSLPKNIEKQLWHPQTSQCSGMVEDKPSLHSSHRSNQFQLVESG